MSANGTPSNGHAEQAIVGLVLNLPADAAHDVLTRVSPDELREVAHQRIWTAATRLALEGIAPKPDQILLELEHTGKLADVNFAHLAELYDRHAGTPSYAALYIANVKESSRLRRLAQLADALGKRARSPDGPVAQIVGDTLREIEALDVGDAERFETFDAKQLAEGDFRTDYLVRGVLAAGVPTIISGSFKTLKTSIAVDLHVSLCTGSPFLGKFDVTQRRRVAFLSGESGLSALQNVYSRVAVSKGFGLSGIDGLLLSPDLPRLADGVDLPALKALITQQRLDVLLLDPAYLCFDLDERSAGNLFAVGRQLRPLADLGQRTGCTIILIHHNTKSSAVNLEPAELSDIQWSGFAEFAGQWLLLSRREKFNADSDGEHKLWLNVGGRPGHCGLWAINATEGRVDSPDGRRWDVVVKSSAEAKADAITHKIESQETKREREEENRLHRDCEKILKVMRAYPDGETQKKIREASGLSGAKFAPAWFQLEQAGEIKNGNSVKRGNGQHYPTYQLSKNSHRDTGTAPGQSTVSLFNSTTGTGDTPL